MPQIKYSPNAGIMTRALFVGDFGDARGVLMLMLCAFLQGCAAHFLSAFNYSQYSTDTLTQQVLRLKYHNHGEYAFEVKIHSTDRAQYEVSN